MYLNFWETLQDIGKSQKKSKKKHKSNYDLLKKYFKEFGILKSSSNKDLSNNHDLYLQNIKEWKTM